MNVLCGRTLEISRMEVLQEEELKIMSNRQQELRLYEREENKKIQNMYDLEDKLEQENVTTPLLSSRTSKTSRRRRRRK